MIYDSEREQEIKYENRVLLKKMLNIDLRTAQAAQNRTVMTAGKGN